MFLQFDNQITNQIVISHTGLAEASFIMTAIKSQELRESLCCWLLIGISANPTVSDGSLQ